MEPCSQSKVTQNLVLLAVSVSAGCVRGSTGIIVSCSGVGDGDAAGLVPPEASLPGKRTPPPPQVPTRSSRMCVLISSSRTPVVLDWRPPW